MKLVSILPTAFFVTFGLGAVTTIAIAESPSPRLTSPTPQTTAKPVPSQPTQRPYLGIQMVTLTPKTAQQINLKPNLGFIVPETEGVLIWSVLPNTPAACTLVYSREYESQIGTASYHSRTYCTTANSRIGESLSFTVRAW
ncbi:MAG: hypothetical protein PUP91_15035 [Rhizonema sp. PD37]|nr:hypothetical protein [Rhizonema sp. PD37]